MSCAVAQLAHRLLQLGLRVHHDRPVPGDRLLDRLAGHQQEADALLAGLHRDLVAAVEHDERAVAGLLAHERPRRPPVDSFGQHAERRRGVAERAGAREDVGEGVAVDLHWEGLPLARRHRDVEVERIGGDALDRALLAPEVAADHAHRGAVVVDDLGDVGGLDVLIARRRHLQRGGRLAQSWKPCMRPCASPCGIS